MSDIKVADEEEGGGITAISLILSVIDCNEPCNSTAKVTWKNTGTKSITFIPAITVNGVKIQLNTQITLGKNQTTIQIFNLANLMAGTYTVCPYPN